MERCSANCAPKDAFRSSIRSSIALTSVGGTNSPSRPDCRSAPPWTTALVMMSGSSFAIRSAKPVTRLGQDTTNPRHLSEVPRQVPKGKIESLKISTARASRSISAGWAVFHNFVGDGMRRAVMQELFPNAQIQICERAQLPHERSLNLRLGDGRNVTMLLDQGLGAWRARGTPRHDFVAEPPRQARSLRSLKLAIAVEEGREAPVVLQATQVWQEAPNSRTSTPCRSGSVGST